MKWTDVRNNILEKLNLPKNFAGKWGDKKAIPFDDFLDQLYETKSAEKCMAHFGRSAKTFNNNIKKHFPNVKITGGNNNWLNYIIRQSDYKSCYKCGIFKLRSEFSNNKHNLDGLSYECKPCDYINTSKNNAANVSAYRARKIQATPPWADLEVIRDFYYNCPQGHHVDHIHPLKGDNICGLHVIENLQYLTAFDNLSKSNKF